MGTVIIHVGLINSWLDDLFAEDLGCLTHEELRERRRISEEIDHVL